MVSFADMAEAWPSPWVARCKISKFTGGILNPRTLANLDCQGRGPKGRVRVGRKICYPVQSIIEWLEERAELVNNNEKKKNPS